MSRVIAAEARPSILCTALTLAPADTARLAAVCLKSSSVTRGTPDVMTALANHPDSGWGRLRWPPSSPGNSNSSRWRCRAFLASDRVRAHDFAPFPRRTAPLAMQSIAGAPRLSCGQAISGTRRWASANSKSHSSSTSAATSWLPVALILSNWSLFRSLASTLSKVAEATPRAVTGDSPGGREQWSVVMSKGGSGQSRRHVLSTGRLIVGMASAFVMAITGIGWVGYHTAVGRIIISHALPNAPTPSGHDQIILLMGLDSRLDQNGQPLPQEMYEALHAGDETSGGYNANVLIVVHISGGDGPVTAVSIPRDDYVALSGCPGSVCKGKIKQAYGLAYQQALDSQAGGDWDGAGATDLAAREQTAREAGRKAEIGTVNDLLGISVDHFVEVTLGAFFQIAKVVEPITVCLNADTVDSYSGADFHQGVQRIDAAQAMAFVRQRRDENDGYFTDFDRTRRQQAFLVSLVTAARRGGALSSLQGLRKVLQVARDNIAVDAGLDLGDL